MECGVGGGGKCYSNYIINVEIARYYSFRFRSCNSYVFISIEQLTRSLVGPMECMLVSSRMSDRKEGQISLIRAPEFVNKVLTCSWRRGEAGKRREEKECCQCCATCVWAAAFSRGGAFVKRADRAFN